MRCGTNDNRIERSDGTSAKLNLEVDPNQIPRIYGVALTAALSSAHVKRVLLGNFAPMLQSLIVEALAGRADVTFVDDGEIDVLLMPAADDGSVDYLQVLWRYPRSRLVLVAPSGKLAVMYELCPRREVLGDLCPSTLVDAVCRVNTP